MTPIVIGQRWVSRHDASITITVHAKDPSGLWICSAASDRVTELISGERLVAEYRPAVDGDNPTNALAVHTTRRGSLRRRTAEDHARRQVPDDRAWEFPESGVVDSDGVERPTESS